MKKTRSEFAGAASRRQFAPLRAALAVSVSLAAIAAAPGIASAAIGDMSVVDVVKLAKPSIARVITTGRGLDAAGTEQSFTGIGTAFVIDTDGDLVTNCHVVSPDPNLKKPSDLRVRIEFPDDQTRLPATIKGCDEAGDIAVIHVDHLGAERKPLKFADPRGIELGQDVITMGFARNVYGDPSVNKGIISGLHRNLGDDVSDLIQTDASINHGNSGGPLLNLRGEVVGVNTYTANSVVNLQPKASQQGTGGNSAEVPVATDYNMYYSRGAETAAAFVQQLLRQGKVTRSDFGFRPDTVAFEKADIFDLPRIGVEVKDLRRGSPAERAGLHELDIVYAVELPNGSLYQITNEGSFNDAMALIGPNDSIKFRLLRLTDAAWKCVSDGKPIPSAEIEWMHTPAMTAGLDLKDLILQLRQRLVQGS